MRVLLAVAVTVLGIAGANAADMDMARGYFAMGQRAAPTVVYDYQPGVVVRAYWLAPWRHRHYYPTTDEKPEIGRYEDLSATGKPPIPPETFQRSWSTSSALLSAPPRAGTRARDAAPEPRAEKFPQPPERVNP